MTTIQTKVCEHCGLTFEINTIKNGGRPQRFCTKKCQQLAYLPKRRMVEKNRTKRPYIRNPNRKYNRLNQLTLQLKKYALTVEDYEFELQNQNYVCAICGQPETAIYKGTLRRLAVDHCQKNGCYRGLLCGSCNRGLGFFFDNIQSLKKATEYLERWSWRDNA